MWIDPLAHQVSVNTRVIQALFARNVPRMWTLLAEKGQDVRSQLLLAVSLKASSLLERRFASYLGVFDNVNESEFN